MNPFKTCSFWLGANTAMLFANALSFASSGNAANALIAVINGIVMCMCLPGAKDEANATL